MTISPDVHNAQNAGDTWPADRVERRALTDLIPYARNARVHSEKQVEKIAASIKEWGWTMPVLIDEAGSIIAGHGRVLAAERLQLADVPVMTANGWSEAQKKAYRLAYNKLTESSSWDREMLSLEIGDIASLQFDMPLIGFTDGELKKLQGGDGHDSSPQLAGLKYSIVVRCADERQQAALLAEFERQGLQCEALIS